MSEILTLFGMMVVLAAVPSASVALVITRSATLGVANGIAVSVGIVLGDLVFILLAIFSLSLIAETMASLFMLIKYLGATYLLWLGFSLLSSKNTSKTIIVRKTMKRDLVTSLLAGFFITLGDLKAIFFYLSVFPVFLDLSALDTRNTMIVILVMVFSIGGVKTLYAFSATKITSIARRHNLDNATRKTAGLCMVGAGGYLVVKA